MTTMTYNAPGNYNLVLELGAPASIGGMPDPVTVDVSNGAVLSSDFAPYLDNESLTFNVANATLVLEDGAWIAGCTGTPIINLSGNSILDLNPESGSGAQVNISANSTWTGQINVDALGFHDYGGNVTVDGGSHALFKNQASEIDNDHTTINAGVAGVGSFGIGLKDSFPEHQATLEFMKSVGAGQTVTIGAPGYTSSGGNLLLQLDDPTGFAGHVTLVEGSIDLIGLASAASYSFKNDMLSIFNSGGRVVDTLHLTNSTQYGFAVETTATSVNIVSLTQPTTSSMGLPMHT